MASDKLTGSLSGSSENSSYPVSPHHYVNMFDERRKIGGGAYGAVYECVNKIDGLTYAVKKIKKLHFDSNEYEEFRREVRVMGKMHHPNVVRFFQSWIEKGVEEYMDTSNPDPDATYMDEKGYTLYIAMEYCPQTLESKVFDDTIGLRQKLKYARQLTNGLLYIHSKNVIHMDISPENILLDTSGNIKISDFGLAIEITPGEPIRTNRMGHHLYAAPDDGTITTKADIFSAGIVIFSLLHPMKSKRNRSRTLKTLLSLSFQESDNELIKFLRPFIEKDPALRSSATTIIEESTLRPDKDMRSKLRKYWKSSPQV